MSQTQTTNQNETMAEVEAYWRQLWNNTEHWPESQSGFAEICLRNAEFRLYAARERETGRKALVTPDGHVNH